MATWGGLTRTQRTSQLCAEKGIPDKKTLGVVEFWFWGSESCGALRACLCADTRLENRARAEHVLQEFEKLEASKEADLIRQYKSKGFAYSQDLSKACLSCDCWC